MEVLETTEAYLPPVALAEPGKTQKQMYEAFSLQPKLWSILNQLWTHFCITPWQCERIHLRLNESWSCTSPGSGSNLRLKFELCRCSAFPLQRGSAFYQSNVNPIHLYHSANVASFSCFVPKEWMSNFNSWLSQRIWVKCSAANAWETSQTLQEHLSDQIIVSDTQTNWIFQVDKLFHWDLSTTEQHLVLWRAE